jgi:hypothetical protein
MGSKQTMATTKTLKQALEFMIKLFLRWSTRQLTDEGAFLVIAVAPASDYFRRMNVVGSVVIRLFGGKDEKE